MTIDVLAYGLTSWASGLVGAVGSPPEGVWRGGRPFIDPMDLHEWWWWTLAPMAVLISVAYKAVRTEQGSATFAWPRYARGVALMSAQIVLGMMLLAVALHVLIEIAVPILN